MSSTVCLPVSNLIYLFLLKCFAKSHQVTYKKVWNSIGVFSLWPLRTSENDLLYPKSPLEATVCPVIHIQEVKYFLLSELFTKAPGMFLPVPLELDSSCGLLM